MTRNEILVEVSQTMVKLFKLDLETIRPEARLYEDLDLDSIDAIDMAVHMEALTGHRISEATLRKIRTVGDIVDVIEQTLGQPE